MTTLKNLVHKGVKVDLGLPFELWDEPSAEVSDMKKQVDSFDPKTNPCKASRRYVMVCLFGQCETMLEEYEEVVEDWYFHHQDQRLENFLCEHHILKASEQGSRKKKMLSNKIVVTGRYFYSTFLALRTSTTKHFH